ncbi:hypothetical protein BT93_L1282 [Corymbia citriodora subsp. variegata]|uniref:Uncharacterized protein n=1 Tax=Corymbia citriodora subsp. variegata TaxID=360336 RepID=A0A8T0CRY9_CORYI|nr:hypothetical protein BT93_L1282 [Corymbia citriodora subsp. variegata]
MEKLPSSKLVFRVMLSALALDILYNDGPMMPTVETRGDFWCPRMINYTQVCQGYPSRCVDGKCICGEDFPPPNPPSFKL